MIVLALNLHQWLLARIAQHLARVELAEVNRLGSIAVRLSPTLPDFVNHPRGHLMLALAQDARSTKENLGSLGCRRVAPGLESLGGGFDSAPRQIRRSFLEATDNLSLSSRIDALEFSVRLDSLAAYDQRILAPQFSLDLLNRREHLTRVIFLTEIRKRLVTKLCLHDPCSLQYE